MNDKVNLTWSIVSNENIKHFVVERATDNLIFENIASVDCSNVLDFKYTDLHHVVKRIIIELKLLIYRES
jgi:hypothetical protein